MNRGKLLGRALLAAVGVLFASGCLSQQPPSSQSPSKASKPAKPASKVTPKKAPPELEARAVDLLKAMSNRLAAANSMSFTALVTYESPSRLGPALAYSTISEVVMQRPDRLRVLTLGDGPASEFYYDGKTMTAFAPAENLVAVAAAPATIDAALKAAFDVAAIYFPFSDIVVSDPYKSISEDLNVAFYIGQSKVVGGTTTNMVAFVNDAVFVQIWIGAADNLPRMLRAVFRDDPQHLRHQMELSNWKLDAPVPADAFASAKAASAMKIAFAPPVGRAKAGLKPPPPAKPPAKVKTNAAQ